MIQFGGGAIFLSPRDSQLGRGEPVEDSAKVLSRMVDCIMLRTHAHRTVEIFAEHSKVPVMILKAFCLLGVLLMWTANGYAADAASAVDLAKSLI